MELAFIALKQTIVMFLLMGCGWVLYRSGKLTQTGSKELANLLIYAILPCAIINAFNTEYTPEKCRNLLYAFALALVVLASAIIVGRLIFPKRPIDNFGVSFGNVGFMGLPLINAVLGSSAVIYIAPLIALLNLMQWTYGVAVLTGKKDGLTVKKICTNPIMIAFVIGLLCFFLKLQLPSVVSTTISSLAAMNSPVAMVVLGVYLAQVDIKSLFTDKILYFNAGIRLILIPLLMVAIFSFLPPALQGARLALMIAGSTPVGSNVAVYAQLNQLDYGYASKTVCLSTIFSVITMPLMIALVGVLWA